MGSDHGNIYVIYYGWLTDDETGEPNDDARRIAAARAPLLIAHLWTEEPDRHRNVSPQVLSLMHEAGTEVFGYVPTGFGRGDLAATQRLVAENLDAGADGIFFDEADSLVGNVKLGYYTMLTRAPRSRGKKVILNPGVAQCGEAIMQLTDRLMVEHRWRELAAGSPWSAGYPADRLMGVSSNEEDAMGYAVGAARAIKDTREAWQAGLGWHTATERYIKLPTWFEEYVEALRD